MVAEHTLPVGLYQCIGNTKAYPANVGFNSGFSDAVGLTSYACCRTLYVPGKRSAGTNPLLTNQISGQTASPFLKVPHRE